MIVYIIKTILCSALFIVPYKLLLEKEKIHQFNRFYLLCSFIASLLLPAITMHSYKPLTLPVQSFSTVIENYIIPADNVAPFGANDSLYNFSAGLLIVYIIITALFFFRFSINLIRISIKITKASNKFSYKKATIILSPKNIIPHSFFNYIFLNKTEYEAGNIEAEILLHELTHAKQKHTFDILFIELMQMFFWFNPLLHIYKKSIKLNHEFLADNAVINKYHNPAWYQYLLISKSSASTISTLSSNFNFINTQKRLIMITTSTTARTATLKQLFAAFLFGTALFIFSEKTYSQLQPNYNKQQVVNTVPYGTGASKELMDEYYTTIKNMTTIKTLKDGKKVENIDLSKGDSDKLANIYYLMNKEQRDASIKKTGITFTPTAPSK